MGRLEWSFFVVVVLVVVAADGAVTGPLAAYNRTIEGNKANDHAFRVLLDGGNREDAVEVCVEKIQRMKLRFTSPDMYSFPPEDFIPEGAQEWCECITSNPPDIEGFGPIWSYEDEIVYGDLEYYRSVVPQGLRDAYDVSFNSCRTDVLEGSNINTVDICRGMFSLFGRQLNTLMVTFCGQLCKDPPRTSYSNYLSSPELFFNYDCSNSCAAEAMPGYCRSTLLEYSAFLGVFAVGPGGVSVRRRVNVHGETVMYQDLSNGAEPTQKDADAVCSAMAPRLGGRNECCNYRNGFSLLSRCCVLDDDGLAVFQCNSLTREELVPKCIESFGNSYFTYFYEYYCRRILDPYIQNSEYLGTAKRYGNAVMFPEKLLKTVCANEGYPEEECCFATQIPFVANCLLPEHLAEYTGAIAGPRPTTPTAGAPEELPADPCYGLCSEGSDCVLNSSGTAFCVECSALLKSAKDGPDVECCKYDADKMKCVSDRKGLKPGKCKRNQWIFYIDEEGDRTTAAFTQPKGYACSNPRDFRLNGKGCKVHVSASGKARCYK